MNPSKHSRSLYFTPRTPWGRLPQNRPGQSQNYLRASENENDRELPEDDKKGIFKGTIEASGGKNQGKTDFSVTGGVYLGGEKPKQDDDIFYMNRKTPEQVRAEKDYAALLAARAKAQAAQQPKKPSAWKFRSTPASEQRVPGL